MFELVFECEFWIQILVSKVIITVQKRRISFKSRALVSILQTWYFGKKYKNRGVGAWWVCVVVWSTWMSLVSLKVQAYNIEIKKSGFIVIWLQRLKRRYFFTKVFWSVIVHCLRTNNVFKFRVFIYSGFTVISMLFPYV